MEEGARGIPTIMVAFGVTGDLMRLKVIPALFALHAHGDLPEKFRLVGFSRRDWGDEEFRTYIRGVIIERVNDAKEVDVATFLNLLHFQSGDFSNKESYVSLKHTVDALDASWGVCTNKIFYFAVAPGFYRSIIEDMSLSGLSEGCSQEDGWTRIIIEKPFGHDGVEAERLEKLLATSFQEEQIYRIDHYLAKESLRTMLESRLGGDFFGETWSAENVESITIRLLEDIGVEKRGGFYDTVGALRDVGQNHMLEILALLVMERPAYRTAKAIREKRADALEALEIIAHEDMSTKTIRAQYDGYRDISGVAPDSITETYFKIRASLRSAHWLGVPIILEAGKRLGESRKEVVIHFKNGTDTVIRIGSENAVQYSEEYKHLLLEAIRGDQTLFVSKREVEAMWRFADPIVRAWYEGTERVPLHTYQPDTSDIYTRAGW
ncbi:MAG: glucose-6-phosphate dehydrogenase [Candidatus Paceibacterota bacterium]